MDAVGLEEASVVFAGFADDVAIPPVGGEAEGARVLWVGVDGDVVGAFEANDVGAGASDATVATTFRARGELDAEVGTGVAQGSEVADLGVDGGEVGHGGVLLFVVGWWLVVEGVAGAECGVQSGQ